MWNVIIHNRNTKNNQCNIWVSSLFPLPAFWNPSFIKSQVSHFSHVELYPIVMGDTSLVLRLQVGAYEQ